MSTRILAVLAATTLLASPVLAQAPADSAAPTATTAKQGADTATQGKHGKPHRAMQNKRASAWHGLSEEGRAILRDAAKPERTIPRKDLQEARAKIYDLMAADKLDLNALKNAMDAQKKIQSDQQERRQQWQLEILQKLSAADRKVYAEAMRQATSGKRMRANRHKAEGQRQRSKVAPGAAPGATTPAPAATTQQ